VRSQLAGSSQAGVGDYMFDVEVRPGPDFGPSLPARLAILGGANDLASRNGLFEGFPALIAAAASEGPRLLEPDGVRLHDGARQAWAASGVAV
jgi:hypothetical protein